MTLARRWARSLRLWFVLWLLALAPAALSAAPVPALDRVPGDRWLEIDLYWFDPAHPEQSASSFWARYAPLYRGVSGYRGLVLNIGFTANFILTYSGDPDQAIALPDPAGQEIGHLVAGQLEGDTAQRQRAWRARFSGSLDQPRVSAYGR